MFGTSICGQFWLVVPCLSVIVFSFVAAAV